MKKQILSLFIILCLSQYSIAQNNNANSNANAQWKINGNTASTTDFMGTTNNQSLVFKTNNIARAQFDTQGRAIFDGGGEVIIRPGGLNRPILTNPIAAYMLKVGGSGHFDGEVNTRQLFVQEYITYLKTLKGPRIDVDTIRMDSTRGIFGNTKIFGDVQIKQDLEVLGKTKLKGDLVAEKGFTFDGIKGLFYTPATATEGAIFSLGSKVAFNTTTCLTPRSEPWSNFYFPGNFVSYVPAGSGTGSTAASLRIGMAPWNGNALIDVSGVGPTGTGTNGLEINTFCKRNTAINCGWDLNPSSFVDGGRVYLGAEVEMMRSLKIGSNGLTTIDANTAIEINQNTDNAKGVNVKTYNNGVAAYSIEKPDGRISFAVYGDGEAVINTLAANAFVIRNASNPDPANNVNFKVKNTGFVYAREVNVQIGNFPDYVFKKEYKLTSLEDVEKYIITNKHLNGFENAAYYQKNGLELGEMVRLQQEKIEELTLYLIELKKEINSLKNAK